MNYIYMLECGDKSLYTGWTTDIAQRVAAHQSGKGAKYTRAHLPVTLVYTEECADKSAALRREMEIKAMPRTQKLLLIAAQKLP
ncbi:MAG: GIY-YIG nuclease family protein [Ruthenibacterium sp.]